MEVNTNFYYLIRFIAEFGRAPKSREIYENKNIGMYFHNIKKGQNKLSNEDEVFLKRLGIELNTKCPQEIVHEKLIILVEFLTQKQRVPKHNDTYKGIRLNIFYRNILSGNTKLNPTDMLAFEQALEKASQ